MNRAITGKGTKNRILLVMGACLPLLAIGCVAQVGSSPEDTVQSSSLALDAPHPVKAPAVGDPGTGSGGGGGDPSGDPQQPPPPPNPGGTTNPGDKDSNPVPSPWYGGGSSK
jgi:hypothetical protein